MTKKFFFSDQTLELSRTHSNPSPSSPPCHLLLRLRLCNLDDIPGATLTMKMKNDSGSEKKR